MSRLSHSWGIFPAFPRDYIRRRRVMRRISNVVIVVLLTHCIAYAIVHFSGQRPFPHPIAKRATSAAHRQMPRLHPAPHSE